MSLEIVSITIKENIKFKTPNNNWVTLKPNNFTFLEIGEMSFENNNYMVGYYSNNIINPDKIKSSIDDLNKMNLNDRIEWFNRYYGLDHKFIIKNDRIMINGSFKLKWGK